MGETEYWASRKSWSNNWSPSQYIGRICPLCSRCHHTRSIIWWGRHNKKSPRGPTRTRTWKYYSSEKIIISTQAPNYKYKNLTSTITVPPNDMNNNNNNINNNKPNHNNRTFTFSLTSTSPNCSKNTFTIGNLSSSKTLSTCAVWSFFNKSIRSVRR